MQPDCRWGRLKAASDLAWKNCAPECGRLRSQALPERFHVELAHAPLDICGSLELFRRSGDDLIDRWDGVQLMRAAYAGNARWVPFVARATGSLSAPAFDVRGAELDAVGYLTRVVGNTFMPAHADYARLSFHQHVSQAVGSFGA